MSGRSQIVSAIDKNTSLFHVKLTDSLSRALTEFAKKGKGSPTITFDRNEGVITIPTGENGIPTNFKFSVSNNTNIEGQNGSFECLRYNKEASTYENLGPLKHKIRVHANDDSFETTKNRLMAIDNQQRKSSTKQIDWNDAASLSKTVKVKRPPTTIPPPVKNEKSATTSVTTQLGSVKNSSNDSPPANSAASNSSSSGGGGASDIILMRKPIKERIIQMLAVKSRSKTEVDEIIRKEGTRDNAAHRVPFVLKEVSDKRDEMYFLKNSFWSQVQEDWPYYTENEKTIVLKKKKMHCVEDKFGVVDIPVRRGGLIKAPLHRVMKRQAEEKPASKNDGKLEEVIDYKSQNKRKRISHFNAKTGDVKMPAAIVPDRDSKRRNMPPPVQRSDIGVGTNKKSIQRGASGAAAAASSVSKMVAAEKSTSKPEKIEKRAISSIDYCDNRGESITLHSSSVEESSVIPASASMPNVFSAYDNNYDDSVANGLGDTSSLFEDETLVGQRRKLPSEVPPSSDVSTSHNDVKATISDNDNNQSASLSKIFCSITSRGSEVSNICKVAPFVKNYDTVKTIEQRRKYKEEFYRYYDEYMRLHKLLQPTVKKFESLAEKVNNTPAGTEMYHKLHMEILAAYRETKNNPVYQKHKARFDQLHSKLEMLKLSVQKFDEEYTNSTTTTTVAL